MCLLINISRGKHPSQTSHIKALPSGSHTLIKCHVFHTGTETLLRRGTPAPLQAGTLVLLWGTCKLYQVQAPKPSSAEAFKPYFRRTPYSSSNKVPKSCSKEVPIK
ncbi:UNVERIFIED_CONTAM: hypothetical protein Sradi_6209400 [Sesamum radiatum]|uniref:Uncharacterized protein n=1 Tax=Sesamum radiatum TaxID=300843 RepID=A0AAW2KC27_SESRA